MREGLMDDCGYHGLDECRNYESCTEEAYNKGYADAIDEVYVIALNENYDTLIEWLQSNLKEQGNE